MGNPKQKWTSEEEEALRAGVAKHGTGKWKDIQRDPEFNPYLVNRSNIDLKDKWRNMSCSANGQGPREKSRTVKAKTNSDAPATQVSTAQTAVAAPVLRDAAVVPNSDDSTKAVPDGKNSSQLVVLTPDKYNTVIFEALSTLKEPNGSDTSAILSFIEQRHEVPPNFRRVLSTRLRRLVAQDKIEKIQNCYKMKSDADASFGTKTPAPKQGSQPRPSQTAVHRTTSTDVVDEAAVAAAYKIAEAENRSFVAAEAVKEAERISEMAEDSESILQLAKEIFEKCSQGETVLAA
ncbi:Telomeric repeat-binding factor [Parasponia andersonii]|uniref:MYB transcription factor n=1 Tax=Parasponia andersonii TaxID=3476 RepID=A0A2P5ASI4_PARAD|nr:Telomeric repeat-binding factor [Parasponia andersonii]